MKCLQITQNILKYVLCVVKLIQTFSVDSNIYGYLFLSNTWKDFFKFFTYKCTRRFKNIQGTLNFNLSHSLMWSNLLSEWLPSKLKIEALFSTTTFHVYIYIHKKMYHRKITEQWKIVKSIHLLLHSKSKTMFDLHRSDLTKYGYFGRHYFKNPFLIFNL